MTKAIKALWVDEETHRKVKVLAAELGITVVELIKRLLEKTK